MERNLDVGMQFDFRIGNVSDGVWMKYYMEDIHSIILKKKCQISRDMEQITLKKMEEEEFIRIIKPLGNLYYYKDNIIIIHTKGIITFKLKERYSYQTLETSILTHDYDDFIFIRDMLLEYFDDYKLKSEDPFVNFRWYFQGDRETTFLKYSEIIDHVIYQESYPYIPNLENYIDRYLQSSETILLLIGRPGTGKTQLIKHILKKMALMQGDDLEAIYSSDKKTIKGSRMFIDFLKAKHCSIVLEDIDFDLKDRKDGNVFMYQLLNASDGLISSIGKKIILSTNLPSVKDIDSALFRPGRCFDILEMRPLKDNEIYDLASILEVGIPHDRHQMTLAEIYRMHSVKSLNAPRNKMKIQNKVGFSVFSPMEL